MRNIFKKGFDAMLNKKKNVNFGFMAKRSKLNKIKVISSIDSKDNVSIICSS